MSSPIDETDAAASVLSVTVTRTGGIAGLRREWTVEPPPEEAPRWIGLIESCPWESVSSRQTGADRFVWLIEALCAGDRRDACLADDQADGPWRTLIDEVRAAPAPDGD